MSPTTAPWVIALSLLSAHCSPSAGDGSGTGGAVLSTGGAASGGAATGGVSGGNGTGGLPGTGGVLQGGTGGAPGTGGSAGSGSGGTPATGGETGVGGASGGSGGASSGGGGSGGESSGGTAGTAGTGGEATGGSGGSEAVVCPTAALPAGDTNKTVTVGGTSRSYVLHVPAAYDATKPTPLVVDFHPLGGSGPSERSGSPYPAQTDPEGVIMAFPTGQSGPSGGAWNVGPCCVKDVDDVAFARALVEQVQEVACIDPKRIYAVGFSMGGGMSHYLGCHAADLFAAIAPAAFDLAEENVTTCDPARPLTVVAFRGTSDPIVPYAGGYSAVVSGMPITFLGAKTTMDKWAEFNGCTGSPSDSGNGCSTYDSCDAGVTVTLCSKQGGGHEPGDAKVAWPILKQHVLP